MEIIGWIGAIAFGLSAVPQAYKSFKEGHSFGISSGLIVLWLIGEIATLIYVWPTGKLPLIVNYMANLIFVGIIAYYKLFPTKFAKIANETINQYNKTLHKLKD